MGLVKTLLILALIYFGLRFLTRLMLPWLLQTFAKKVNRKMADQMNQQYSKNSGFEQADKDVFIKRPNQKNEKSTKDFDGGEYVDFEEVED